MLVEPVFLEGALVAFVACTSHLIDLGGLGMGPEGSDVFDEGFLVPPCRLVDKGEANEFLIHLIKANSRSPVENEGDIYALIACCDVGCARLAEMMHEFRVDSLEALSAYVVDTSRGATEDAIQGIPNGVYRSRMRIDGYDFEIDLAAALHVEDRGMLLDLDGSSPCSRFGINVPINYTNRLQRVRDSLPRRSGGAQQRGLPRTLPGAGAERVHRQRTPSRAGGDAAHHRPAHAGPGVRLPPPGASGPGTGGRRFHHVGPAASQRVRCRPQEQRPRVCGGADPQRRHRRAPHPGRAFGHRLSQRPSGARRWRSRRVSPPCGCGEGRLRPDSGGAGTHRGGLGQVLEVESRERAPFHFLPSVERIKFPARGRNGGADGAAGRITLESGTVLPGKGDHVIPGDDCLIFETPGGAGYGPPEARDPRAVIRDVRDGIVTPDRARELYRVVIDEAGGLDSEATARLRENAPAGTAGA